MCSNRSVTWSRECPTQSSLLEGWSRLCCSRDGNWSEGCSWCIWKRKTNTINIKWYRFALLPVRQIWYSHILVFTNLFLRYYSLSTSSGTNTVNWYIIGLTLFKPTRTTFSFFYLRCTLHLHWKSTFSVYIVVVRWWETELLVRIFY